MRACYYDDIGAAQAVLHIADMPTPACGAGEVRVKLATSGVNPSDVKTRGGRKSVFPRIIPHSDGAGVIDQVGDGVDKKRIGERVWIWNGQWKRPFGTAADYIALPAAQAVPLPDAVTFAEGACLGIPAMTAFHAVERAMTSGKTLLISGGAGAVSQYAIQFAKMRGATVLTTISSPEKAKVAREAGADHAIDYKTEDVGERVMALTDKRGVDAVIELNITANAKLLPAVLRAKGSVIVYGIGGPEAALPAQFCLSNSITVQFFLVYELDGAERASAVAGITAALKGGHLVNRVDARTFSLGDTAAAHEAVEQGAIGNVVVTI
ncbi:MAG: NADPH:quinone reductase [Pseudolabrys sp.]|jgi:NADPH2:quinone reductase